MSNVIPIFGGGIEAERAWIAVQVWEDGTLESRPFTSEGECADWVFTGNDDGKTTVIFRLDAVRGARTHGVFTDVAHELGGAWVAHNWTDADHREAANGQAWVHPLLEQFVEHPAYHPEHESWKE